MLSPQGKWLLVLAIVASVRAATVPEVIGFWRGNCNDSSLSGNNLGPCASTTTGAKIGYASVSYQGQMRTSFNFYPSYISPYYYDLHANVTLPTSSFSVVFSLGVIYSTSNAQTIFSFYDGSQLVSIGTKNYNLNYFLILTYQTIFITVGSTTYTTTCLTPITPNTGL
jgi:hypothetical protein